MKGPAPALLCILLWFVPSLLRAQATDYTPFDPFAGGKAFTLYLNHLAKNEWCYPLSKGKIISPFGGRDGRAHQGTDIKTHAKDSIRAAFDGIVTMSQPYSGYGNCIILRHSNGMETLYSHNHKNMVKVGDYVRAGQVIALTGRTGKATTEHLHFEVRVDGHSFDSSLVFDHSNYQLRSHRLYFSKGGGVKILQQKK